MKEHLYSQSVNSEILWTYNEEGLLGKPNPHGVYWEQER